MSDLVERLRAGFFLIEKEAADEIERLQRRVDEQQAIMDKCACVMEEAMSSEDGIDTDYADECIKAIQEGFAFSGKTTIESRLYQLYVKICEVAGFDPEDEINVIEALDNMKSTIVAATGERCANICKTAADRLALIADDDFNGVEELEKCEEAQEFPTLEQERAAFMEWMRTNTNWVYVDVTENLFAVWRASAALRR